MGASEKRVSSAVSRAAMSALSLQSLAERARDAGATLVDAIAGTPPYATRLARVSARSGYLCGLAPNAEWQRRYFVLKPTTMLYYFGSDMDEEPLGCVDVEAFTSVSCRDVDGHGRVVIELARAEGAVEVAERPFTMREVKRAADEGRLLEVFGAGTAAVICPINRIFYEGDAIDVPTGADIGPVAQSFWRKLSDIHYGRVDSPWAVPVDDL